MPRTTSKAAASKTSGKKGKKEAEPEKEVKEPIFESGQIFIVAADDSPEETFHIVAVISNYLSRRAINRNHLFL